MHCASMKCPKKKTEYNIQTQGSLQKWLTSVQTYTKKCSVHKILRGASDMITDQLLKRGEADFNPKLLSFGPRIQMYFEIFKWNKLTYMVKT